MKALRFVVLVPILCMVVLGAAQNNIGSEFGAIQGTVTRTDNGEPLAGATVTLQGGNADPQAIQSLLNTAASQGIVVTPPPGASTRDIVQSLANAAQARGIPLTVANIQSQLASFSGRTAPTAATDGDGRFAFRDVTPGFYTIRVQKEGFFGKPEGGTFPPTAATDVSVAAKEVSAASLSMTPGALIGGRVYGVDGQLLPNAIVWAMRVTYPLGYAVLSGQVSKLADDRGEFRLFWIPPGDYYLTAEAPRAASIPGGGPAGQGIKTFYPGVTDVTEARTLTVKGGEEMLGMDVGIRGSSSFKVSGQITSLIPLPVAQNAAGANAAVLVLLGRDATAPDDTKQVGTVPLVPTIGKFEISNILPGTYDLFARVPDPASQASGGAPVAWGRARLDVRDMDVPNVSIVIPPAVDVRGTVSAGGGKMPSSIRVQLMPDDAAAKIPAYQQVSRRTVPVDAAGAFAVPAVPAGRFRVSAIAGLPPDMYLADVRQSAQSVFDTGFDVNSGNTAPLEIALAAGAGSVTGVVVDGPMKVVPGATVVLVPETKRRSNRALYVSATSDAYGRFSLRGVSPGDYKVFAWESIPTEAYVNAAFMVKHEDRGKPVHVGQQGTVSTELTIISAVPK
ncbi:MAG TPA: carboxypeptidase-like regulatory domain-containing protein [Terriglobia bacterium]|nr:carboxypeptidase-like regulatory domain-containing protein [Terriglobia bacterium]